MDRPLPDSSTPSPAGLGRRSFLAGAASVVATAAAAQPPGGDSRIVLSPIAAPTEEQEKTPGPADPGAAGSASPSSESAA